MPMDGASGFSYKERREDAGTTNRGYLRVDRDMLNKCSTSAESGDQHGERDHRRPSQSCGDLQEDHGLTIREMNHFAN